VIIIYVIMALIGAAVAIFAVQNLDPVVIRFLGWRREGMPLAVVILISLVAGLAFASLVGFMQHLRLRRRIRQLQVQLHRAETAAAPSRPTLPSDHGFR
jgi:lipopolysaccharide assembly protein A